MARPGAGERAGIEAPRTRSAQLAGREAAVVERLQGMKSLYLTAIRSRRGRRERGCDHVPQLGEHGRARHGLVGTDVAACTGYDEVVTGGENRFEQRLADFRARVSIANQRGSGSQIVAVDGSGAARAGLVEPENANHPEGQPPQRRQRTNCDTAPEKVGAARGALNTFGKNASHVCERDLDCRGLTAHSGLVANLSDDPAELVELPPLGYVDFEELPDRFRQGVAPRSGGPAVPHVVGDTSETCDEVGKATGDGYLTALDSEGGDVAGREADVIVAHRDAHEHPVNRGPPRVGGELRRETPRRPMRAVEAPAHVGRHDPPSNGREGVVVEVEALADRRQRNELEHLRGCEPPRDQSQQ